MKTPDGRASESEGGGDEPLRSGAPSQQTDSQPDFLADIAAWRSKSTRHQRHAPSSATTSGIENIPAERDFASSRRLQPAGVTATAIKALFSAAKAALCQKDEDTPRPPSRRRRGETGKGFAATCRMLLRRAAKTGATARGRYAALRATPKAQEASAPASFYASAAMYLADTLDWLTLWQDNAHYDHWHDDTFSAKQEDYFPQP